MNFLKKALANTLGIGGCKVDTIIFNTSITPGETITGIIKIYGGRIEQYINGINLVIRTKYEKESKDKKIMCTADIQNISIAIGRSFLEDENFEVPFSFKLNDNCPISTFKYKVWISTILDIANAIDAGDGDTISVVPSDHMQNILNVLSDMGFKPKEIENIPSFRRINKFPFVQEFELIPTKTPFKGKLDELEIVFSRNIYGIDLYIEVDRKANSIGGLIAEHLNLDESRIRIELENKDLDNIRIIYDKLFSAIISHS